MRIYPGSVQVDVMSPERAVSKQVYPQPLMPAKGRRLQRRKLEFSKFPCIKELESLATVNYFILTLAVRNKAALGH